MPDLAYPCGGIKPPDAVHAIDKNGNPLCRFTTRPLWPKGQTYDFDSSRVDCEECKKVLMEMSNVE